MRQLCLIPSLGMINRRVIGCQIELEPAQRGQEAADLLRSAENQPELSSPEENYERYSADDSAAVRTS